MSDTPNVVGLPDAYNKQVAQLEELKRNMDLIIEFKKLDAQLKFAHYTALIKEGFNPDQALAIAMRS